MDFFSPPPTALCLNRLQGCASRNHISLACRRRSLIQLQPICYQKVPWLDYYMNPNLRRGGGALEPGGPRRCSVLFQRSPSTQEDRGFAPQLGSLKVLIPSCGRLKVLSAHLWGNQSSSGSSLLFSVVGFASSELFSFIFSCPEPAGPFSLLRRKNRKNPMVSIECRLIVWTRVQILFFKLKKCWCGGINSWLFLKACGWIHAWQTGNRESMNTF